MKANLQLFEELIATRHSISSVECPSIIKGYIWRNGILQELISPLDDNHQLAYNFYEFPLGSMGKIVRLQLTNDAFPPLDLKGFFEVYSNQSYQQYAYVSPRHNCIYVYDDHQVIIVNGTILGAPMKQCGVFRSQEIEKKVKTEMNNGRLLYQPIANGQISAMFSLETKLKQGESTTLWAWAVTGDDLEEARLLDQEIYKNVLALS